MELCETLRQSRCVSLLGMFELQCVILLSIEQELRIHKKATEEVMNRWKRSTSVTVAGLNELGKLLARRTKVKMLFAYLYCFVQYTGPADGSVVLFVQPTLKTPHNAPHTGGGNSGDYFA